MDDSAYPGEAPSKPPGTSSDFANMVAHMNGALGNTPDVAPHIEVRPPPERPSRPAPVEQSDTAESRPMSEADFKPRQQEAEFDAEGDPYRPKAQHFKTLKRARDDFQKLAKEREEKLSALEKERAQWKATTGVDPQQVAVLQRERDELHTELERTALERLPQFRNHFQQRLDKSLQTATALLKNAVPDDEAIIETLTDTLTGPSKGRSAALSDLSYYIDNALDKERFTRALAQYDETVQEREQALQDSRTNLQEYGRRQQQERLQVEAHERAQREQFFSTAVQVAARQSEAFRFSDDPKQNAAVTRNVQYLQRIINGGMDLHSMTALAIAAAEGERHIGLTRKQAREIEELREGISRYQGARPSLEGRGAPRDDSESEGSFVDQVLAAWPSTVAGR